MKNQKKIKMSEFMMGAIVGFVIGALITRAIIKADKKLKEKWEQ